MEQPTRIQFRLSAGPHERYTDRFAQSLIGQTPRINVRPYEGGPVVADYGTATVVAAEVIEDGAAVLITYETTARERDVVDLANMAHAGILAAPTDASMSFVAIPAEPSERDHGPA